MRQLYIQVHQYGTCICIHFNPAQILRDVNIKAAETYQCIGYNRDAAPYVHAVS